MKIVEPSGFADLDAARTLVEIANAAEVVHDGRKLITLRDAALYITKLPKAEHDAEERQAAMEALLVRSRPLEELAAFLTRN